MEYLEFNPKRLRDVIFSMCENVITLIAAIIELMFEWTQVISLFLISFMVSTEIISNDIIDIILTQKQQLWAFLILLVNISFIMIKSYYTIQKRHETY